MLVSCPPSYLKTQWENLLNGNGDNLLLRLLFSVEKMRCTWRYLIHWRLSSKSWPWPTLYMWKHKSTNYPVNTTFRISTQFHEKYSKQPWPRWLSLEESKAHLLQQAHWEENLFAVLKCATLQTTPMTHYLLVAQASRDSHNLPLREV